METIAVIGGGPAGYVAAITAAQKGRNVILIERQSLGGTCLNEGCMPTKALLETATRLDKVKEAHLLGVKVNEGAIEIDWSAAQQYKNNITTNLVAGIQFLMKKNKITVLNGEASFIDRYQLQVLNDKGVQTVKADKYIIATGADPIEIPIARFDGEWVINSTQALTLSEVPDSLLIIGGGVIGCEFASIYSRLGTKVTIVEMSNHLLPGEDAKVVSILENNLKKSGVTMYTSSKVINVDNANQQIHVETNEGKIQLEANKVLVSVGRKPRVTGLNLENIGVKLTKQGSIQVNEAMETTIPGIYACGDVIGGMQLAHVGFHEGKVAAANACGEVETVQYHVVPRCIYTSPEIASVGLNESQAKEQYGDIRIGEFSFSANGKAMIEGERVGKVKVIVEAEYNEIVGVSIIGPHATELIGQGVIMMHSEMTADAMKDLITAHPTLSESIHEALLSVIGEQIHF
ncbi:dihydrolipoyl dehydrogenase [Bacillus sp. B15-48]|uniref:dihydrolipoyl dehydrogenase n=1 Tax=Bacillus sp. B15-48 TaxID=1548601 RepID=UPI00193EEE5F|nr:dihydrolipoyl dehydrogenase [Bacillus sp. B15-48]MBM4763380.1 dihydrolipoyl dehydrogenase [Bacillus sp. B15-48]